MTTHSGNNEPDHPDVEAFSRRSAVLAWPTRDRLLAWIKFQLSFFALFFPIYLGAAWLTDLDEAFPLYWQWETRIPLVDWMVLPYLALYPIFVLPLFHLSARQYAGLTRQSVFTLLVAGLTFLLLPAQLGFPATVPDGPFAPFLQLVKSVDTPYNLVPSLHVAFTALLLLVCAQFSPPRLGGIYIGLLALVSVSTLFVHQHHVIDILAGIALALVARRIFPIR